MNLKKLQEKIVKSKVVRDMKRNIIKKTTDKDHYKIEGGKEVKMSTKEELLRKRGAKRGSIKRKSTQAVASIKAQKSKNLR